MPDALAKLTAGAAELGLTLESSAAPKMLDYLKLLNEWNRAFNLTAVGEQQDQVALHLLDSLSVYPFIRGSRAADVGTGAGLPGIPLAMVYPDIHWTLIDSTAKKLRFVQHVVRYLELENVEIHHTRAEDYRPESAFDTVVARAVAALPKLVRHAGHLLAPAGSIVAMKGRNPVAEAEQLGPQWQVQIQQLVVPGLDAQRHLALIKRS